jgi:FkbM family methyltransferase
MSNHFILNYFPNSSDENVIVECGAFRGGEEDCVILENLHNWKYYGIEPAPDNFLLLNQFHSNGRNSNIALSNLDGEASFTEVVSSGLSSLTHHEGIKKNIEKNNWVRRYNVQTLTWRTFVKVNDLKKVNLMIIDTEGHEVEVLHGMMGAEVMPDVICIEFAMSDRQNNLDGPENFFGILKINEILTSMGYVFDYVKYNNAMFSKKEMWEGKVRPENWHFEDEKFELWDVMWYDREKLKSKLGVLN